MHAMIRPAAGRAGLDVNTEHPFQALRPTQVVAGLLGSGTAKQRIPALSFAIVDEVDSILVDEARTPLILSGSVETEIDRENCLRALETAALLRLGQDYRVSSSTRQASLTTAGRHRLDAAFENVSGRWASTLFRDEMIVLAIAAGSLIERDRDYVVRDGKVEIVDEFTGRTMPDRSWRRGLHQLVETKEGLELSEPRTTLGYITYQSLFRRYDRLAGMSGTVAESVGELWQVFGTPTARIPTHREVHRSIRPTRSFRRRGAKMTAVAERAVELSRRGAPVLVGTRTVAASEEVAALLANRKVPFALLNAVQDADEAAIVARAGEPGCITIATNMAGRGTDIVLTTASRESGGLHVLMTERHEATRIDRQLAGRCARQGDPGVFQAFLSLEDDLLAPRRLPRWLGIAWRLARVFPRLTPWIARRAQHRHPDRHRCPAGPGSELKQHCATTGQRVTVSRMRCKRCFRRRWRLATMTGTAREVAHRLSCWGRPSLIDALSHGLRRALRTAEQGRARIRHRLGRLVDHPAWSGAPA